MVPAVREETPWSATSADAFGEARADPVITVFGTRAGRAFTIGCRVEVLSMGRAGFGSAAALVGPSARARSASPLVLRSHTFSFVGETTK